MALVVLSVVEQRLDAVRAVLFGESVVEVAVRYEVARSTLHRWVGRYLEGSVAGLADRSHRLLLCPHRVDAGVEAAVAEVRRRHPRGCETDPDGVVAAVAADLAGRGGAAV